MRALVAIVAVVLALGAGGRSASADDRPPALVFTWDKVAGAASYVIEIAEDRTFTAVAVRATVPVNVYRWQSLSRQPYYWRVKAIEPDGREGKFSEVRVIGAIVTAPVLREPAAGARMAVVRDGQAITLRWDASAVIPRYQVEVARDAGFTQIVTTATVTAGAKLAFVPPELGDYHWRVGGVDATGASVAPGAGRAFVVVAGAPELVTPTAGATVPWVVDELAVPLAFTARGGSSYEVVVAADKAFRRAVLTTTVTRPTATFRPTALGTYHWRARAGAGTWSKPATFTVALARPTPIAPGDGWTLTIRGPSPVELTWGPVPQAASYVVDLEDAAGAPQQVTVTEPRAVVTLPPGGYRWTVRAETAAEATRSPPSEPRGFTLSEPPLLAAPTLTAPAADARVELAAPGPVALTWSAVDGAVAYDVELAATAEFAPVLATAIATAPRAELAAPVGTLHWRARARAATGEAGAWSAPGRFLVAIIVPTVGRPEHGGPRPRPGARWSLDVAPRLGVHYRPGGFVAPTAGLEVGVRLGRGRAPVRIAASVQTYAGTTEASDPALQLTARGEFRATPVELIAATRFGPLYLGAGVAVTAVRAHVRGDGLAPLDESSLAVGGVGLVGAERRAGPAALFAEVGYAISGATGTIVAVDPSGATMTIGYRMVVW